MTDTELLYRFRPKVFIHPLEPISPISFDTYFYHSYLATCKKIKKHRSMNLYKPIRYEPVDEQILISKGKISLPISETEEWSKKRYYLHYTEEIVSPSEQTLKNTPWYGLVYPTEKEKVIDLVYIFNFCSNSSYRLGKIYLGGDHLGDIEHIRVRVDLSIMRIVKIYYSAHGWDQGAWRTSEEIEWIDYRPVVYIAKGSHAIYHKEGTWLRIFGCANDHTEKGLEWNPLEIVNLRTREDLMGYRGWMSPTGVRGMGLRDWKTAPSESIRASSGYRFFYPLSKYGKKRYPKIVKLYKEKLLKLCKDKIVKLCKDKIKKLIR